MHHQQGQRLPDDGKPAKPYDGFEPQPPLAGPKTGLWKLLHAVWMILRLSPSMRRFMAFMKIRAGYATDYRLRAVKD